MAFVPACRGRQRDFDRGRVGRARTTGHCRGGKGTAHKWPKTLAQRPDGAGITDRSRQLKPLSQHLKRRSRYFLRFFAKLSVGL
jgi:hypothetical protein